MYAIKNAVVIPSTLDFVFRIVAHGNHVVSVGTAITPAKEGRTIVHETPNFSLPDCFSEAT